MFDCETTQIDLVLRADLLENWPATLANGRASGFQSYISHLSPGQVVIGYPAPDASGNNALE